jgi:rubredoxin
MYNYLYLIKDKRDIGSNVYKIGKTTQLPSDRFKGYEKGTYPIRISQVDNCNKREYELIDLFKKKYELSRGREYFNGNLNDMIKEFNNFCNNCINLNNNKLLENKLYYNQQINNYTCKLCNYIFKTKFSLERHQNKKTKCNLKTEFKCEKCNKSFKTNQNLNYHIDNTICDYLFIENKDNKENNIDKTIIELTLIQAINLFALIPIIFSHS